MSIISTIADTLGEKTSLSTPVELYLARNCVGQVNRYSEGCVTETKNLYRIHSGVCKGL